MRIGQYTDSFLPIVDGVGRVVESYAKTLYQMGHEPIVFTPNVKKADAVDCPFPVVTYQAFSLPKFQYRLGVPQLDARFHRQAHRAHLDIVHVHSPFLLGQTGIRNAKRHGIPIVGTFHSKYYDDFLQVVKLKSIATLGVKQVARFYEQCDEVWAVTKASADTLHAYGLQSEIVVMPNGTEMRTLDSTVFSELRERYTLKENIPLLLYVGQLNWKKNIRQTLEAVAHLRQEGTYVRLLLAGKGPHRDDIQNTIDTLGLADSASLIGHLTSTRELDGLYALADLFVFPSLYDNGPMVVREAAAMGTPSILIAGSSAAESITDGYNGFACQNTKESIAQTIQYVIDHPEVKWQVSKTAQETIPVEWATLLVKVVARYAALIEKKGR